MNHENTPLSKLDGTLDNPCVVIRAKRKLFSYTLQRAAMARDRGAFEEVLQWISAAAWFASRKGWFGDLNSPELEAELLHAACSIPTPVPNRRVNTPSRWLHVMTEAYGTLGHTNLCRRWIQYDKEVVHDLILLDQGGSTPENLVDVVRSAGGKCIVLDPVLPLLERAARLRSYAWENADVVVLHIHPADVVATTAFGVAGGPPVLVVNHADHSFWVGCAIADLVVDIRTSGQRWTRQNRGVDRTIVLPLPLVERIPDTIVKDKRTRRRELGLPENGTMFLTVGSAAKYRPMRGLNFVDTAQKILRQCPEAIMVAVGLNNEGDWKAAAEASGGRLLALVRQPDAIPYSKSADVYVEGFPAGSLTALLEAGESGIPCVLAPGDITLPYCTDDPAMDHIPQPANVDAYVATAVALARNADQAAAMGRSVQQAITACHCGEAWLKRLNQVKRLLPSSHFVYPRFKPLPIAPDYCDLYTAFLHRTDPTTITSTIVEDLFIEVWKKPNTKPKNRRAALDESSWRPRRQAVKFDPLKAGSWSLRSFATESTHSAAQHPRTTAGPSSSSHGFQSSLDGLPARLFLPVAPASVFDGSDLAETDGEIPSESGSGRQNQKQVPNMMNEERSAKPTLRSPELRPGLALVGGFVCCFSDGGVQKLCTYRVLNENLKRLPLPSERHLWQRSKTADGVSVLAACRT